MERLKELRFTNGYERIPYDSKTQKYVHLLAEAWKAFVAQSLEEKMKFEYENGGGYENKGPDAPDYKEDFHFRLDYKPSTNDISQVTYNFLYAAKLVMVHQNVIASLSGLLTDSGDFDFNEAMLRNPSRWILRTLSYPPQEREFLALEHPDKGPGTIHLHDSTPGLQAYLNGKWEYMNFAENEAVCYPGLLGQYLTECNVKALPHRVVSTETSRKEGRYSIVIFADFESEYSYNKKGFGSTQEVFPGGKNLDMGFEEFSKYFTDVPEYADVQ